MLNKLYIKNSLMFFMSLLLITILFSCEQQTQNKLNSQAKKFTQNIEQIEDAKVTKNLEVESLVVYSPHDADPLNEGIKQFETAYPNIQVEVIADGSGNLLNRIKAEATDPQCDVIWGACADSLEGFKDYFEPYIPKEAYAMDKTLSDKNYTWIGESPLPIVFIADKNQIKEMPNTWNELALPKWKGKIVMANPVSSGSAYTQLCLMLMLFGKKEDDYKTGWDFVRKLLPNLVIQDSSSSPHKLVDSGEYPIGITFESASVKYDLSGKGHLKMIYPKDGTSIVPDGIAIIKNCNNLENAKKFVDFVLSADFQKSQNVDWKRRPIRNDVKTEGLIDLKEINVIDYNFNYAGTKKNEIVNKWKELLYELG